MSKVADYLRGHITGEVTTRKDIRDALSTDTGVLAVKPDIVVYPRTVNDIRKVTRFAWQLAEKGHVLPVTVRGAGSNSTGASIGSGVSVVTTAHMNRIFEYDEKQRLVRLQPGVTLTSLSQALSLHGTAVMPLAGSYGYGTVGGALAEGVSGLFVGKYGKLAASVDKLEVVLANGDLLQTGRISKRELSKKKGLQGLEGDIYRGIDAVLEDYADTINSLQPDDNTGYSTIANVRAKDGSIDLTPLFLGSQGTLGVIAEMIMKSEHHSSHYSVASVVFSKDQEARDVLDALCALKPAFIEYIDARLFENASAKGKVYDFYQAAQKERKAEAVILIGFDDFGVRNRAKHLKRVERIVAKSAASVMTATDEKATDMLAALEVAHYTILPDKLDEAAPNIFGDFYMPAMHFDTFLKDLDKIAEKLHVELPICGHAYTGIYGVYPTLKLSKVSDKQKIFKILDELAKAVLKHGGSMASGGGEGRLKAQVIYSHLDEKTLEMFEAIKKVFDPHSTLNPGVKQSIELRKLATMLRGEHDAGQLARFGAR